MNPNTEDFTFPIIITTNNIINEYLTVLPPPLWRFSSLNHQSDPNSELQPSGMIITGNRVFTGLLPHIKSDKNGSFGDGQSSMADEEKMDGLWEGFNEEAVFFQEAGFGNNNNFAAAVCDGNNSSPSSGFCCSSQNDDVFEEEMRVECGILCPKRRRKKLGLVGKMLKKLFLLQKPKHDCCQEKRS